MVSNSSDFAVSIAMGNDTVVLTTGGRSEEFAKKIVDLPEHSFVQMGDFSGYTIQQCSKKNIKKAYVVGFIGKLAKMAAGVKQTHVKGSKVDMKFLSELAENCGANETIIGKILKANTARHVSEIIKESEITDAFIPPLVPDIEKIIVLMRRFAPIFKYCWSFLFLFQCHLV